MGIVDFTPKKKEILDNQIMQVSQVLGAGITKSYFVENYKVSNSELIPLYSNHYESAYSEGVVKMAQLYPTVIINTPFVSTDVILDRMRPDSFYNGLKRAQDFNRLISAANVVDLPDFDINHTYDGIHYTNAGNIFIFNLLKDYL